MDVYLIRHADSQAVGEGITRDADRPLTAVGQMQCLPLAAGLHRNGVRVDRILSSPLLRARQTAEGIVQHWKDSVVPEIEICDDLAPGGKRRRLTRRLRELGAEYVALVGHMPNLAEYGGWLIGSKKAQLDLPKAGVARINFSHHPGKGQGALLWLIPPEWFPPVNTDQG
jgi:phosphohistidine phosphatase